MNTDPDRLLNQLVVAALTIFIALIFLVSALLLRQIWLHRTLAQTNEILQETIDDLEETTRELQSELTELQSETDDEQLDNWEDTEALLDDVDVQLETIEDAIDDVELGLSSGVIAEDEIMDETDGAVQDQVDQVFTALAVLIALASIAIAIFLGMALRVRH